MKIKIFLPIVLAAMATMPAESASILSLDESIDVNNIIYPESFETDVKKMRENWYLTTYAVA